MDLLSSGCATDAAGAVCVRRKLDDALKRRHLIAETAAERLIAYAQQVAAG